MTVVKLHNSPIFLELLMSYGEHVKTQQGNVYFRLPYWFQITDTGYLMHNDEPEDLSMFLAKAGLGSPNPQVYKPKKDV